MAVTLPSSPQTDHYLNLAEQVGQQHHFPPGLMGSTIYTESGFNPQVVSNRGAIGLMQIMPGKGNPFGYTKSQLENPDFNIQAGGNILDYYTQKYAGGNVNKGLEYYNAGPGTMARNNGAPPASTQQYVNKIKKNEPQFAQYGYGNSNASYGNQPPASIGFGYGQPTQQSGSPSHHSSSAPLDPLSALFGYGYGNPTQPGGSQGNGSYPGTTNPLSAIFGFGNGAPTNQNKPQSSHTYSGQLDPLSALFGYGYGNPTQPGGSQGNGSYSGTTNPLSAIFGFGNGAPTNQSGSQGNHSSAPLDPLSALLGYGAPVNNGGAQGGYSYYGAANPLSAIFGGGLPTGDNGAQSNQAAPGPNYPSLPAPSLFQNFTFPNLTGPGNGNTTPSNGNNGGIWPGINVGNYGFTPTQPNGNNGATQPGTTQLLPNPTLMPASLTTNGNSPSQPGAQYGFGYNPADGTYLANPFAGGNNPAGNGSNPFNSGGNADPFGNLLGSFFGSNGFTPATSSPTNGGGNYGPNNAGSGNPFDINSLLSGIFGNSNGSPTTSSPGNSSMPVIQFPGLTNYGGGTPGNQASGTTPSYQNNDWLQNPALVPWAAYSPTVGGGNNAGNSSLPTIQFPGLNNSSGYGTPNASNNPGSNNPFDLNSMLSNIFGGNNTPFGNSNTPGNSSMPTIQFPGLNGSGNYGAPAPSGNYGANSPGSANSGNPFDINSMLSGLFGNSTSGNSSMPTIQFPGLNPGLNNGGSYGAPNPSSNYGTSNGPSNPNNGNPFDINSMLPNIFGNSNSGNSSMPTIQFPGLNNGGSYSAPAPSSNYGAANNTNSSGSSNPFDINSMLPGLFGNSNSGNSSMPTIQFPGLNNGGSYGSPAPSNNNSSTNSSSPPSSGNPIDINSMLSGLFGNSNSGNSSMPTIQFPGLNSGGSYGAPSPANNTGASSPGTSMPVIQFPGLDTSGSSPTTMGSTAPADNSTSMPTITFPGLDQSTAAPPVDPSQSAPPVDPSQSMPPMDPAQSAPPMDPSQSAPPVNPGAFDFGLGGMGGAGSGSAPAHTALPSKWQFMEAGLNFHLHGNGTGVADHPLMEGRQETQLQMAGAGQRAHGMPGPEQALSHLHA